VAALRSDDAGFDAATQQLAALLAGTRPEPGRGQSTARPASVAQAVGEHPNVNLVSIAVPGAYAAFVAHRALDAGRNVFLFSDNVALSDEVALKARGRDAGLLVMGPDCGTAIIDGVGLGFANRVARGPVGIVGASGTGTQEVCCLLSRFGVGVSHAIGTGSRDLSADVHAVMSRFALRLLADDHGTRAIVLVAKHPAPAVADMLHGVLAGLGKPAIVRYLGEAARPNADGVIYAETLDDAARAAAKAVGADAPEREPWLRAAVGRGTEGTGAASGRLIGLFGGGSLAAEARHVLATRGIETTVPALPLVPDKPIPGTEHLIVDTGDDAYTVGRPHPMVDQAVRCGLIRAAGADRTVGILLLDLVLGDGAHPDPAPEIATAVGDARAARGGQPLAVVCSVCGSADDPQGTAQQAAALGAAGIHTARTAAEAARLAAMLLGHGPAGSAR
jgi:succinyl-CoA synthetase alpha subunit